MTKYKGNKIKQHKLGIFLGTFDPIHNGHLHIAKNVIKNLDLDNMLMLPSYDSPHKADSVCCSPEDRLHMCKIACEKLKDVYVSDIEIKAKFSGYSLEKIDIIVDKYPDSKLYYVIGSDAYITLMKWNDLDKLINKVSFCVVIREKNDVAKVNEIQSEVMKLGGESFVCDFDTLDISSTNIRKLIEDGDSVKALLPKLVDKFISDNVLYKINKNK